MLRSTFSFTVVRAFSFQSSMLYCICRNHQQLLNNSNMVYVTINCIKMVYGHFGTKTLRHQDTSAPVPKCPSDISAPVPKCLGHFGTDHRGSHACQRRQYLVDGEGSLKQSTFL